MDSESIRDEIQRLMNEQLQRELDAQVMKTITTTTLDPSVWATTLEREYARQSQLEASVRRQRERDEAMDFMDYFRMVDPETYNRILIAYRAMKRVTT